MFSFIRPFIFNLDPEKAHDLAIKSLKFNILPKSIFNVDEEEMLETSLFNEKSFVCYLSGFLYLIFFF